MQFSRRQSVQQAPALVTAVLENIKKQPEVWMLDRLAGGIRKEVPLCNIGLVVGLMDEHAVPRPLFWGVRVGHRLIPFLAQLKGIVRLNDYTSVVRVTVINQLSNHISRMTLRHD